MTNKVYQLKQGDNLLFEGHEADVREKIEELLEERVGMFVSLQENVDEDEDTYEFYLHTDNDEELSEKQLDILHDEYGIDTMNDANSEQAIKNLLNIDVTIRQVVSQ
jgi:uncharacterized protein (DUF1697 family)